MEIQYECKDLISGDFELTFEHLKVAHNLELSEVHWPRVNAVSGWLIQSWPRARKLINSMNATRYI